MDELDNLYFGNKLAEVAVAVASFPKAYNLSKKELYDKILDNFKNGFDKEIHRDLYEAYGENLRKAVDSVLGDESYGDEYFDMRTLMHANLSRFAAYKAYHATQELKDISPKDIEKRGRLVLNKYNRWQATEYNTAVARARTAKQYHDFTSDPVSNKLYPNIKWLPSRSATPREAHRVFWNRVWAKDDPFWNSNTPGSLWNCKCDWEETDEPVTNGNPTGNMSAKGLEGNPAVTGEIFYYQPPKKSEGMDRRHSYFSCSNTKKKKIEDCICENVLRGNCVRSLKKLQSKEVPIKKGSEIIDVVFDSKTTKHLSNDAVKSVDFFWKEIFPNVDKLLENARLVAHENNTKTDQKPSAIHYYYYECMVGKNVFYLSIEENYVVRENRHFYRLYSITHRLRDSAIMY